MAKPPTKETNITWWDVEGVSHPGTIWSRAPRGAVWVTAEINGARSFVKVRKICGQYRLDTRG